MIRLLPEERAVVHQHIYAICGISLDASKDYLIEGRLGRLVEDHGCRSFAEFVGRAKADARATINRRIIDEITTGETLFFRDSAPFDLLRHKVIPEMIDRRSRAGGRPTLRVWSAACSTGQELYSIAMVLRECLGDVSKYNLRLIGTDISDQAVAKASEGIFGQIEIERGLNEAGRQRFFTTHPRGWRIQDEIRAMVTFRRLNLFEDFGSLGKFDILFCRNVAIYFNELDKKSVFDRLGRSLESDGCLVIGAMETLSGVSPQFESMRHLRTVYYRLKGAIAPLPVSSTSTFRAPELLRR
ncbi:MAG: protein-glutamate O-methyltransferase CheR [Bryobacteraceae bacterium]